MTTDRYRVVGSEGDFEPGSDGQVLRNIVGIQSAEDMDELELSLLAQLYEVVLIEELPNRQLSVDDLKNWHQLWLGNVYAWAGQERSVNMSKGGFAFAAAAQVPRLLADFERRYLARWTPCGSLSEGELIQAIAEVHVEFILIHPFREGNGRLSRLLVDVMAVQAGHAPLDYSSWESEKPRYIAAIHAGFSGNYAPMCACVRQALKAGDSGSDEISGPA